MYGMVYGLYDPRGDVLRYIGQTTQTLNKRLAAHMIPANLKTKRHSACWLAQLRKLGLKPFIRGLKEASSREDLDKFEVQLISEARSRGEKLTNVAAGGGGSTGTRHTEESKRRRSERMMGRLMSSPEHMAHLAEMKRGVPRSEETKSRISVAKKGQSTAWKGRKHTESTKLKISASRTGTYAGSVHHKYKRDIPSSLILAMLQDGHTKGQIAKQLGVLESFVYTRLRAEKKKGVVPPVPKSRRLTFRVRPDISVESVVQLHDKGMTNRQVAAALGIHPSLVHRRLVESRARIGTP